MEKEMGFIYLNIRPYRCAYIAYIYLYRKNGEGRGKYDCRLNYKRSHRSLKHNGNKLKNNNVINIIIKNINININMNINMMHGEI